MKSYTDIKQSKKLAEILPIKSADMYYWCGEDLRIGGHKAMDIDYDIPCWSLAALLDVIPKEVRIKGQKYAPCLFPIADGHWLYKLWYNSNEIIESPIAVWCDNPLDACYELILKLHERKML